jgi:peroxiredoxin
MATPTQTEDSMRVLFVPRVLVAAFAFLVAAGFAGAAAADDLGPAIGTKVPTIGTPPDQSGTPRTLDSLMGEKGLVLFFFRSADWCPNCQAQLMDLNTAVDQIKARGYNLAGISYDSPEIFRTFIERRGIKYTLLSDPKSVVIDRYKLRDPQYKEGSRAYGVPRPIIFILRRDGTIESNLYEEAYKKRPPATLVVATIDKIEAGKQ